MYDDVIPSQFLFVHYSPLSTIITITRNRMVIGNTCSMNKITVTHVLYTVLYIVYNIPYARGN